MTTLDRLLAPLARSERLNNRLILQNSRPVSGGTARHVPGTCPETAQAERGAANGGRRLITGGLSSGHQERSEDQHDLRHVDGDVDVDLNGHSMPFQVHGTVNQRVQAPLQRFDRRCGQSARVRRLEPSDPASPSSDACEDTRPDDDALNAGPAGPRGLSIESPLFGVQER